MTREEVQIIFGANADEVMKTVDKTTNYIENWQKKVENMQRGYTGWWAGELKKRELMEVASATRAAEAAAAITSQIKAAAMAKDIATNAAAQTAIAAGSVPANMAGGALAKAAESQFGHMVVGGVETVAGGYVFAKATGKLLGKVGDAEKDIEALAHGAKGLGKVFTEIQVIGHELLSGRWKQALSSFTRLLGFIGMGASAIPIVGAGVAGIIGNWHMRKELEKMGTGYTEENRETDKMQRAKLMDTLGELAKLGKITASQRAEFENESTPLAQKRLFQMFGGQSIDQMKDAAEAKKNEEKIRSSNWETFRKEGNFDSRIQSGMLQESILREEMNKLQRNSVEWTAKAIEAEKIHRDVLSATVEKAKAKADEAKRERDFTAEVTKIQTDAAIEIQNVKQKEAEGYMPTLQELAGRGIFRGQARWAMKDERLAKRAYEYGNVGQAESLIADRDKIYDSLHTRGVQPERAALHEIATINQRMAARLLEMGTVKSPLLTAPKMK